MKDAGKILIVDKGDYSPLTPYEYLDSVMGSDGIRYISKINNNMNNPLSDSSSWAILANKGDKGDTYNLTEADKQDIAVIAAGAGARYRKFYVDSDGYLWVEAVDPINETYSIDSDGYLWVEY